MFPPDKCPKYPSRFVICEAGVYGMGADEWNGHLAHRGFDGSAVWPADDSFGCGCAGDHRWRRNHCWASMVRVGRETSTPCCSIRFSAASAIHIGALCSSAVAWFDDLNQPHKVEEEPKRSLQQSFELRWLKLQRRDRVPPWPHPLCSFWPNTSLCQSLVPLDFQALSHSAS